jgi:sugar-specific transcriptional regulator TrmB
MNQTDILANSLVELGLNDEQIKIYLYYLTNNKPNISAICNELEINRVRGYQIITQLEQMQLLIKVGANNSKVIAASPLEVLQKLKAKLNTTQNLSESLSFSIPALIESYFTVNQFPKVKYYHGRDGFRTLLDINLLELASGSEYLGMFEDQKFVDIIGDAFLRGWIKRRTEKNITLKLIASVDNKLAKSKITKEQSYMGEIKFTKSTVADIGTLSIAGSKIIYWNTNTLEAMVIENEEINKFFRTIFYILWESLE